MKWCVLVLVFAGLSKGDNAINTDIFNCPELNSQEDLDLDKIMGKWYVVEVLEHRIDPLKPMSGSYIIDSCPIVTLRPLDHASLRLLWSEDAGNLEYVFRIPDIVRRKGLWRTMTSQNGTLAEKQYKQFTGSVHVMKAVASDMVLTFCSRSPNSQLYSLLLSREHILQKSDKRGVHNLLGRRGLKIVSIRETCVNGGAGSRRGALDLAAWTTLVGLLSSSFLLRPWQW
ncbi:hypothetical protein DMN91_005789 [Ooceraea biroi]|uniref:Lipocalin/cytosolic fatty-acid binding domain-containing protein n=2 Tax=Ooceraea biroi TaxID=2015173 RepID=A0A3L8DM63_OOCBI|nr:uncharacterized protein LOC105281242 [Ooceraea biroi]RLU21416.1 hypothetical protein DMN91_005789 [Ooceraea biroi]